VAHWFQPAFTTVFAPRFRWFVGQLSDPARAQRRVLRRVLRQVGRTAYGRAHGIDGRENYAAFRRRLPIVTYEDVQPWIEHQARSHGPVLVSEPVRVFEKTSGSTGHQKLIPYTPSLLRSFGRMAFLWAYDVLAHGPRFTTGKMFFSISPPLRDERCTPCGVPVGFDDDSAYLSPLLRRLFGSGFVQSPGLKGLRDPLQYRRLLAATLVAEPRLEVLFVWHPTYLTSLLEFAEMEKEQLLRDLWRGAITVQGRVVNLPATAADRLVALAQTPIDWRTIWPALKLISCWTDAGAAPFARRLGGLFPGVRLQGKGLLATEAPMTVPLFAAPAPVPLVDEVFFEFEDAAGDLRLLHELQDDGEYEVIVTQQGGLSRYRMNDRVRVCGRYARTPCLRFIGRARDVSDLVGEKLHETFARAALRRTLPDVAFAFLVPVRPDAGAPYYLCIADQGGTGATGCATRLESELLQAFHYRQARFLGQLGPVRVAFQPGAVHRYDALCAAQGIKWGNVKYSAVLRHVDAAGLARLLAA
jgi:hypothetical protein